MHVRAGACGGQKTVLEPLQLEVWAVVSLPTWVLGFCRSSKHSWSLDHLSSPLISTSQIRHLHCNFMMNIGFVS